jgi:hypothetical protein
MSRTVPQASLVTALVESLLPTDPVLDVDVRADVATDVAHLVVTQIRAMPPFLRLPYRAALLSFDLLPVLSYGRSFRALDRTAREGWIRRWDERGLRATRAFVKLVRSCTLFAWYDHPRVAAALGAGPL